MKRSLNYLFIALLAFISLEFLSGCGKNEELKSPEPGVSVVNKTAINTSAGVWYKGNLHTHANNDSDADSDPLTVARWYRDNNYDFLVISSHNKFSTFADVQATIDAENAAAGRKKFLLIPGEEVTDKLDTKNVHVGAINISNYVATQGGTSISNVLQRDIDAVQAAGGLAIFNHPNLGVGIAANDANAVRNLKLMEIVNGHPHANGAGLPPMGEYWDDLLSRPHAIWGVAVDDAHNFQVFGPTYSNPGRGWVQVNAASLTAANIVSALNTGNFYASTGVTYSNVSTANNVMSMTLTGTGPFTTTFIGKNGAILKTDYSNAPTYTLPAEGQLYVRAKTNAANGSAWTQPLYDKSYIVDNAGSGFSASTNWKIGTAGADKYKTDYHYRTTVPGGSDRASFTVGTAHTGDFDIYAWWSVGTAGNRTPQAHYFLPGGQEVIVDQRINGGKWNYLGTVRFNAEGNHTVYLSADGPSGYAVIADAVMMYGPK
ncbi:MAG TPA: CehA/McbA family metallohydrolase [Sphingobacteriaceae bacterium]|nr:CehA/McbA family metallohydrolase [Sphingobacteriaceae bacterium]